MLRLGIIGCSDIAYRRFMPAVKDMDVIQVQAVAEEYAPQKLEQFCKQYSIEGETSFEKLLEREDIDAVYIPQPPAMHYRWAKYALERGKHVLIEKPSTTSFEDSKKLVEIARGRNLALHENYMFQYHSQIKMIQQMIYEGMIGEVRLLRANFGFPMRQMNDFRYSRILGGGALLDAGGYTLKLATLFLGPSIKIQASRLNYLDGYEVDMYGNATLSNDDGTVCQVAFGMDCAYQCSFEAWGSKGILRTDRIFTAPADYEPVVEIDTAQGRKTISLKADHHFKHSIEAFCAELQDSYGREKMYGEILLQASLVDGIRNMNN